MSTKRRCLLIIIFPSLLQVLLPTTFAFEGNTLRIGFGSCNNVEYGQDFWRQVSMRDVDVWLWLGDNVYADVRLPWPGAHFAPALPSRLRQKYKELIENPYYRDFSKSGPLIKGTWDDHDYGPAYIPCFILLTPISL